jgi:hypothetical protein
VNAWTDGCTTFLSEFGVKAQIEAWIMFPPPLFLVLEYIGKSTSLGFGKNILVPTAIKPKYFA